MPRKSNHPGVAIRQRKAKGGAGAVAWQARWTEPRTGRQKTQSFGELGLATAAARVAWAQAKSRDLLRERAQVEAGVAAPTRTTAKDAVAEYLAQTHATRRAKTHSSYAESARLFLDWARRAGVAHIEELTAARLDGFRAGLIAAPRREPQAGGARGARRPGAQKRAPRTVNRHLRAVGTMLERWRVTGRLPKLTSDGIADALRRLPAAAPAVAPLTAEECARLLKAAAEYSPACAAYTALVLLTGCRAGEMARLTWGDVDLSAQPALFIRADQSKTRTARQVDLTVAPSSVKILRALKPPAAAPGDFVFGARLPDTTLKSWRRWLIQAHGAPAFTWQRLRQTCGTFLTNAPGIFGAASAFRSARQLGHSVTVAEKHYLGVVRGVSAAHRTLEAAMGIGVHIARIIALCGGKTGGAHGRHPAQAGDAAADAPRPAVRRGG